MVDEVKTAADLALRDNETPGLPASGAHHVLKSEARAVTDIVNTKFNQLEAENTAGKRVGAVNYAALALKTTYPVGTIGEVPIDAGTHTDPVVGGTVSNSGVFIWSASPAGWQRVDSYRALSVASQAETDAGTDDTKGITPLKLRNAKTTKKETVWLQYVSGLGNAMVFKPLSPNTLLTGDATQYRFRLVMPFDAIASTSAEITQYDGTPFLPSNNIRMVNGVDQLPAGVVKQYDVLDIVRNPVPIVDPVLTPGLQGVFRIQLPVDFVTERMASLIRNEIWARPPRLKPVLYIRESEKVHHFANAYVVDDIGAGTNQDVHHSLLYDYRDAVSVGGLPNAHCWSVTSEYVDLAGLGKLDFGMLFSDEGNAGVFDAIQPSIPESIVVLGDYSKGLNALWVGGPNAGHPVYNGMGPGHGNVRLVPGTAKIEIEVDTTPIGAPTWSWLDVTDKPIGTVQRGRSGRALATYEAFRLSQTGVECVGTVSTTHTWGSSTATRKPCQIDTLFLLGDPLAITAYGPTAIAEGDTVTTPSGGSGTAVIVCPTLTSGSIAAGTAVGTLCIRNPTGTWVAGEDILVGGVKRATVGAAGLGAPLGVGQWAGTMLVATVVNRAKAQGHAIQNTGYEKTAPGLLGPGEYSQPHGTGSRAGFAHASFAVVYEAINLNNAGVEASCPLTPPGDYSQGVGVLTGWWVQDREEGVRKFYNLAMTGAAPIRVDQGRYTVHGLRQFRRGALI